MSKSNDATFKEILTSSDVMDLLCVSRTTVHRLQKKGELTGYKFSGRVYYKRSEVLASIESGKLNSACAVSGSADKAKSTN